MKKIIGLGVIGAALGAAYWAFPADPPVAQTIADAASHGPLVAVSLPDPMSENAQIGKIAFDANCAGCHGANAAGQDGVAPPLVHVIYEPNHHGDESFQRAAAAGVQSHHWRFGNMPPVDGITRADVAMIVAYIRELQRANGIN